MMNQSNAIEFIPEDSRLTTFPIARPTIFEWYKDSYKCYWTVEEIDPSADARDYLKLTPGEQHFVKHVLAFFAASDGIVNLNLAQRFKQDIKILEVGYFYDFQIMMENVHAHTYSILLEVIIPSQAEKAMLFNAITTLPIIQKMSQYMFRCIDSAEPIAQRLLRMACVEGIFFTGCFCAIYWLQTRGLMPALGHSNELIARDEAFHTMFALFLYNEIIKPSHKPSAAIVGDIFEEAVGLASEFIGCALPMNLPEMNAALMTDYIKCQADILLALVGMPPIYKVKHNFHFMEQINCYNKTNFFERRTSEYSKAQSAETKTFDVSDDF